MALPTKLEAFKSLLNKASNAKINIHPSPTLNMYVDMVLSYLLLHLYFPLKLKKYTSTM